MPDRPEDSSRAKSTTLGFRSTQGIRLPLQLTSFVGRERALPELAHLVGTARLMTLTGAGGIGKTRLAVEVGQRLAEQFADGVWLVDLASVADARLVPQAVASVLGISEQARQALMDVLTDGLRSRALLLVLDNCEHLVDSCGELAQRLLQHCPDLRILATSREPLGGGPPRVLARAACGHRRSHLLASGWHPARAGAGGGVGQGAVGRADRRPA